LRHEREVHKLHGGTEKAQYCPHRACKRHSGSGFTRKENLLEHLRRVHRRASADGDGPIPEHPDPQSPVADPALTTPVTHKRKRSSATVSKDGDHDAADDELRAEIKRLRAENEQKDERLRNLEEAVRRLTALSEQTGTG